jgi:hypothetical protein
VEEVFANLFQPTGNTVQYKSGLRDRGPEQLNNPEAARAQPTRAENITLTEENIRRLEEPNILTPNNTFITLEDSPPVSSKKSTKLLSNGSS